MRGATPPAANWPACAGGRRAAIAVGLALLVAGGGTAASRAACRGQGDRVHRLCLRRLQRAEASTRSTAWLASPYRALGIYIGGVEPRLLEPAALRRLDRGGGRDRVEPDPAVRRPAGAVRRPGAALAKISLHARLEPGNGRGRRRRRRRERGRPRRREARSTSTWRATRSRTRRAPQAVQAFVSGLGERAPRARLPRRGLRQRRLDDPRPAGARRRPPRRPTTSGSRTGTATRASSATRTSRTRSGRTTSGSTSTAAAHHETWGGVTIDIDSNYVDAAVVGSAERPPLPAPPTPLPSPGESAAGSVTGDGRHLVGELARRRVPAVGRRLADAGAPDRAGAGLRQRRLRRAAPGAADGDRRAAESFAHPAHDPHPAAARTASRR